MSDDTEGHSVPDPPVLQPVIGPAPDTSPPVEPAELPTAPPLRPPMPHAGMPRSGMVGLPLERSANFRQSMKRLIGMLHDERSRVMVVAVLAVVSVSLSVLGPRILGYATDIIFKGLLHGGAKTIDFTSLHRVLLGVVGLYLGSAVLAYIQAYILAGIVQRTMDRLRTRWRTSSTGCPSATSTASPAAICSAASPTTSTTSPRACSRR